MFTLTRDILGDESVPEEKGCETMQRLEDESVRWIQDDIKSHFQGFNPEAN